MRSHECVTALPVQRAGDGLAYGGDGPRQRVPDVFSRSVNGVHSCRPARCGQAAGVMRLTAAPGVERRSIQRDVGSRDCKHDRLEFPKIGIDVV